MSGIFVFVASPAQNTTVGRRQLITGSFGAFNGAVNGANIRFGAGGSINLPNAHGRAQNGVSFGWDGLIPNNIRPGQAFQVTVSAFGTMQITNGPEPEFKDVDGQGTATYVLENIVPVLTMEPFQTPISTLATSCDRTFRGTVTEQNPAVYGFPQVQYRVDNGPLLNAAVSGSSWSASVSLPPGDHTFTVQASDPFASVTTIQKTIRVLRYPVPVVTDPAVRRTKAGVPTTSSVTTWTRLEPQCASADMGTSTSARLFDPLWLMTRQWQMGEFQAEDTGSPVQARVRATSAALTRAHFGEPVPGTTTALPYDPAHTPLEPIVEHRPMRPAGADDTRMLTVAVDAGLHFLRLLEQDAIAKKYRATFLAHYALRAPSAVIDDDAASRFVQAMAGRAPDARKLAVALRPPITFNPELNIATADAAAVRKVATVWTAWYDGLFSEPTGPADDAWQPARLEYAVSVATRLSAQPQDTMTYSATEFDGGLLDWSGFDVNGRDRLDTTGDQSAVAVTSAIIPSPVVVRGAPAARFWEVEDAKVAYGLVPVGPTDLAHLMMIEYASTYGNDWYVVPLDLRVGTVTRVDSLVVTDTFGVRNLLRPIGDPALPTPYFSMWQSADLRRPGERLGALRDPARSLDPRVGAPIPNRFLLAPSIGRSIDGAAVEDVLFMRDEMANVAWAIERSVESPVERAATRTGLPAGTAPDAPDDLPRYLLSSSVPENWIPLLPVQMRERQDGPVVSRLRRGSVLQSDGTGRVHTAVGQVLNSSSDLLLYDEEVPREGVRVTRARRMVRWLDGTSWVWTGLRKQVGRGEGSSGLVFDQLLEPDSAEPRP